VPALAQALLVLPSGARVPPVPLAAAWLAVRRALPVPRRWPAPGAILLAAGRQRAVMQALEAQRR